MNYLRPALVLLLVFLVVGFGGIAFQAIRTVQTLAAVEAERDQWQRPVEVLQALGVKEGSTVVDFGSGSGYFALKLSDAVGSKGEVIAVDLRRFSLLFLHLRALLRGRHNIQIIVGDPDDPHQPESRIDSVLIANTYHELTDRESILKHLSKAVRSGGTVVIVDRSDGDEQHHVSPGSVETDLRKEGFEIKSREDSFIKRPGDSWWLIVADRP